MPTVTVMLHVGMEKVSCRGMMSHRASLVRTRRLKGHRFNQPTVFVLKNKKSLLILRLLTVCILTVIMY